MTSLYIHLPFCESKCYYCDFCSGKYSNDVIEKYFDKLVDEITLSRITDNIETIFIGGGTPSSVSSAYIGKITDAIYKNYSIADNAEISIECNPNSLTIDKANDYKGFGINRVSLGVQTTSNELLKAIGRIHNFTEYQRAAEIIATKFNNYNFDLMLGLPNQSLKDVEKTLIDVLKYNPPHISAYSLILEPSTPLAKMVADKTISLPNDDFVVKQYDLVHRMLEKINIKRYEISNFAKPQFECKHNRNYWACGEYLGFGISAHSYKSGVRFSNTSDMKEYINGTTKLFEETLTLQEKKEEMIMLALRTGQGLDLNQYSQNFGENLLQQKKKQIANLQKANLIVVDEKNLKIAPNAFYISNSIIEELI